MYSKVVLREMWLKLTFLVFLFLSLKYNLLSVNKNKNIQEHYRFIIHETIMIKPVLQESNNYNNKSI